MSNYLVDLTGKLAEKLGMVDGAELLDTLKATAFKGEVTDAQMTALLIVANQFCLNPWTKEIYAYPDKNGIVPVVGVDGWVRIINAHPQFDGMEFFHSDSFVQMEAAFSPAPEWMECRIHRKDRSRPIIIREYLDECYRKPFSGKYGAVNGPWQSHPKRLLRHKVMIQSARIAFGFGGIYDEDEAERIREAKPMGMVEEINKERQPAQQEKIQQVAIPAWPTEQFEVQFTRWEKAIQTGVKSNLDIIALAESKGSLTKEQRTKIMGVKQKPAEPPADAPSAPEQQQSPETDGSEGAAQ